MGCGKGACSGSSPFICLYQWPHMVSPVLTPSPALLSFPYTEVLFSLRWFFFFQKGSGLSKVKHRATMWPKNSTRRKMPKSMENICPYKIHTYNRSLAAASRDNQLHQLHSRPTLWGKASQCLGLSDRLTAQAGAVVSSNTKCIPDS